MTKPTEIYAHHGINRLEECPVCHCAIHAHINPAHAAYAYGCRGCPVGTRCFFFCEESNYHAKEMGDQFYMDDL